jgi:hypothetical protein
MDNRNLQAEYCHEDEIDLIDLIKILIKNIKFIVFISLLISIFGFLYGLHIKKVEKVVFEQKFELELPDYKSFFSPLNIFYSEKVLEFFSQSEMIKKLYPDYESYDFDVKRKILNGVFRISSPDEENLYYRITVEAESENDARTLIEFYYEKLSEYVDEFYKNEISLKYEKNIEQYNLYKDLYEKSQNKIKELLEDGVKIDNSVNSIYVVEALKEVNTKLFLEKDIYASLYKSSLNERLNLEKTMSMLGNYVKERSLIYKLDRKINIRLIAIISCVL